MKEIDELELMLIKEEESRLEEIYQNIKESYLSKVVFLNLWLEPDYL